MGKAEFTFNGTTTPQVFMPIPGITTYNFVVIGAAGGLGGPGGDGEVGQLSDGGNGGKGAVVTTTYTNITQPITIVIGGVGDKGTLFGGPAGGGGLTQVFNNAINIIAGGGGGGGAGGNIGNNGGKGGNGGSQGENGSSSVGGSSGGVGGSITGTGGGNGGSFNSNGNGFNASADIVNTGGGGGGAGINGITGSGGGTGQVGLGGSGGVNGGGGGYSTVNSQGSSSGGGGGAAGYGGGGGGTLILTDNNNVGGGGGGGGGSSIVLLGGQNTLYTSAPYKDLIYGSDDGGRGHGYVLIYWNDIASNICFPAGTPVRTDQGIIPIEKINTNIHTINRQSIKHITQTVTHDKYLIHFQPNSIGHNMPDKPTTMSKDHKILYNGNLVPAFRFLDLTDKVKKIKYSGEILYNVLLHDYSLITVNNMKCETLHPENAVAQLYLN